MREICSIEDAPMSKINLNTKTLNKKGHKIKKQILKCKKIIMDEFKCV